MNGVLKISEATSLAIHAILILASKQGELLSAHDIAETMRVSEAHLAKVLQGLVRAGFLKSMRGPTGGFLFLDSAKEKTLLDVYQATEGPLSEQTCLLPYPICGGGEHCVLGALLHKVNREVREYLSNTKLAALTQGVQKETPCAGK